MIHIEVPLSNRVEMLSNVKEALVSAYPRIMDDGCSRARLVACKRTNGTLKLTYEQFESDWEVSTKTRDIRHFRLAS